MHLVSFIFKDNILFTITEKYAWLGHQNVWLLCSQHKFFAIKLNFGMVNKILFESTKLVWLVQQNFFVHFIKFDWINQSSFVDSNLPVLLSQTKNFLSVLSFIKLKYY